MWLFQRKSYRPGSANFESYRLKFTPETIRVVPTGKLLVFYGIFALVGLFVMTVPLYAQQHDPSEPVWPILCFGSIFLALGGGSILMAVRRLYPVIDLQQRFFYPQGRDKRLLPEDNPAIPLSDITAITLASRMVSGRKSRYRCYTLGLMRSDSRDFVLLNHGALNPFMRDARMLSQRLGLSLPERDFEVEILAARKKAAPFLLIFSLIWLLVSGTVHRAAWDSGETFPIVFTGIFIFLGLVLFLGAVKQMLSRK